MIPFARCSRVVRGAGLAAVVLAVASCAKPITDAEVGRRFEAMRTAPDDPHRIELLRRLMRDLRDPDDLAPGDVLGHAIRSTADLYLASHDEWILDAMDGVRGDGGFVNSFCGFYLYVKDDAAALRHFRTGRTGREALQRCIGITFRKEEAERLVTALDAGQPDAGAPTDAAADVDMDAWTEDEWRVFWNQQKGQAVPDAEVPGRYRWLGIPEAEVASFVVTLKHAVATHDAGAMSRLINYPLRAVLDGADHQSPISTPQEFEEKYDRFVNAIVVDAVKKADAGNLFSNYQGIMLGNGVIWFDKACVDDACTDRRLLIRTIQGIRYDRRSR